MRIVSILNHKGGVGKTTLTGSIAQALALVGYRCLLIDNDSQHNLSAMLGTGTQTPNICDIYRSDESDGPAVLLKAIRKTALTNLHIITSQSNLFDSDVRNIEILKTCIQNAKLDQFYNYILIDNAPGMGLLQGCAVTASDEIFVPTELRQFAVDGIVEMAKSLDNIYGAGGKITKIIPNFYKNTKRQNSFLSALRQLFPGKVTETALPIDNVFDELITENKVLFLHRLYSKGAAFYLKLIHELFNLEEEHVWEMVVEKRTARLRDEARERFFNRQARRKEQNS